MSQLVDRRAWLIQSGLLLGTSLVRVPQLRGREAAKSAKQLITRQENPFNAEPDLGRLADSWITPWELFFVRIHGPTPEVDTAAFRMNIDGLVEKPQSFSVAELRDKFRLTTVAATLTCAGNRREEFSAEKKVGGVQWTAGAIGNAHWAGFRLSDVLKAVGVKSGAKYVWLEGQDEITDMASGSKSPFGGSISLERGMTDSEVAPGALLATHMNDKPLTRDHGAPLRLIVPGYIGARSVKWLRKITISDQPSPNRFIARDYKLLYEGGEDEIRSADPILEFALNSAITSPKTGGSVKGDRVTVRGYALAPGQRGRQVAKVEVSGDDGKTWQSAQLTSPRHDFTWVTWSASVPIAGEHPTLVVRATDNAGDTQPEHARWNVKGYMNNSWHHVTLNRS